MKILIMLQLIAARFLTLLVTDDDKERGDVPGWVDRLTCLLRDPDLRGTMSAAARAEAERHSWRASTQTLVGHYEKAVQIHARLQSRRRAT